MERTEYDIYIPPIVIDDIVIPEPPPDDGETDPDATIEFGDGSSTDATSKVYASRGITSMVWAQEPYKTLWCTRSDGLLLGFTYDRMQQVSAWHRHPMENGAVLQVTGIPDPATGHRQVWMIVQREVDGVTKKYVEYMLAPHTPTSATDTDDFIYLDSSLTYDGSPVSTINGLSHLEGETVSIWADGVRHPDRTVASGSITLDDSYSTVHVGIHSASYVQTLPSIGGAANGTAQGKKKTVSSVRVYFHNTIGGKAGLTLDEAEDLNVRSSEDDLGETPAMQHGVYQTQISRTHNKTGQFFIIQDIPGPMEILALLPEIDGTDY